MTVDLKRLIKEVTFWIFFIFIVNFLAMKFFLYHSIWYFDMPMHFLGGFWLSLMFIFIFEKYCLFFEKISFIKYLIILLGCVLVIGLFWEFFEFGIDRFITFKNPIILDMLSDLFFDLSGGVLGFLYFIFYYKKFKN